MSVCVCVWTFLLLLSDFLKCIQVKALNYICGSYLNYICGLLYIFVRQHRSVFLAHYGLEGVN